jgi:predicted transcriptional regulator of viral defense system
MSRLQEYAEKLLSHGKNHFSREQAATALHQSPELLAEAARRLVKKGRLAMPRRGFYLVLRPEDEAFGAPDPIEWLDALMKHMGLDYRVSLLRAAAFHGSTHQAVMVFQVITPKQIRGFDIGRHRLQFIFQASKAFAATNQPKWLTRIKSKTGYTKVAGIELTVLDSARYFHKAAGINGAAQVVHDLGSKANPRILATAARNYEKSSIRRLGYLLDLYGHERQATALLPFAQRAKSMLPLDPSAVPIIDSLETSHEINQKWKLAINEPVEIDT